MELFIATLSIRLAFGAAVLVAAVSLSVGAPVLDAVTRAAVAAVVFTLGGRWLIGLLETPEHRLDRLRASRRKSDHATDKEVDE